MMRVLLTGTTSQHVSKAMHERCPTFAGVLRELLESSGAEVVWTEPSLTMDQVFVESFDQVIVGIASPASLASYHLYGALSVIGYGIISNNLTLFTDSPEPHRIAAGLQQVSKGGSEALLKPLYARRKGYQTAHAQKVVQRLLGAVGALSWGSWPSLLYPSLPWLPDDMMYRHLPLLSPERNLPIMIDRMLIKERIDDSSEFFGWVTDEPSGRWAQAVARTLAQPVSAVKIRRTDTAEDIMSRMNASTGVLVGAYRAGDPWWTSSISLGLSAGVPVASDWRLTQVLGKPWTFLPSSIEQMSRREQRDLSRLQTESYIEVLPSRHDLIDIISNSVLCSPRNTSFLS